MTKSHLDVLSPAQREIWPHLSGTVPDNFVLYGGTAITLHLGHRPSRDFDFFTGQSFAPDELKEHLVIFPDSEIQQHLENNLTLSVPVRDDVVRMSFFGGLPLAQIHEPSQTENGLQVASLPDLLGTKCKVIMDRADIKDYLDIIAILKETDLTLTYGIAAAVAIYGESFVPISSLKALSYTSDLSAMLSDADLALIQKAVTEVALDNLPVLEPLGLIGEHTPSCDRPACGPK